MPRLVVLFWLLLAEFSHSEGLTKERLGVIYDRNDRASTRIAQYYADRRQVPPPNLVGLSVPHRATVTREELRVLRAEMLEKLPSSVEALLLIWSRPYAAECMSITTAMASGYRPDFCEAGCGPTLVNPLYDTDGWLPADTIGWLPAMLLPSDNEELAHAVIDRGYAADGTRPPGTVFLISTQDTRRNVRSARYGEAEQRLAKRVAVRELHTPIDKPLQDIIAYFTGAARVEEMKMLGFRPGAAADHLTSSGGVLDGGTQMSAVEWLQQGATGSYGSVSEPCNLPEKFPDPAVFFDHYRRGDTLLEAYWKSVDMPGQGLFIGEPLSRPFDNSH